MQITDVTATTHKIPVEVPMRDEVRHRYIPFVVIETDDGITGYGQTGDHWWRGVRKLINDDMGPTIEGMSPIHTERVHNVLQAEYNPRVQTGAWSSAISAIDLALWDIKGKYYDEPVWRLLGGARNPAEAYITFGLKTFTKDQLVTVAQQYADEGHGRLKMKVAVDNSPKKDAERVRAVREAVGEDVNLMIDANYEYSFPKALELCNRIEEYNISWFEEPVYGNDVHLLSKLNERTRIPICAGQNEGDKFQHRDMIEAGAIDICQPNVLYVGGYTEAQKVAALAESYNLEIANGAGWPFQNMHLHAGVGNGWLVEFHYIHWNASKKMFKETPEPEEGKITIPDRPGIGLKPDWDALDEFEIE